jgi:hypothetical protein
MKKTIAVGLLLFLLFAANICFGQASYCSGVACDPSNGLYLPPYTQNFTPGGNYSPDNTTVFAHLTWSNWPDTIHWAISYHGSAVGSMTGIVGFGFGSGCAGSTSFDGLCSSNSGPLLASVSPGELVCIVVDGSASEGIDAWKNFMTHGAPLPSSSYPGFAVCWQEGPQGRTLRVPQDFPTVQGAVAASISGDTIVVSPGLYAIPASPCTLGNGSQSTCGLVLHDGTTLVGSGPAQTVLDFSGAQIGILLQNGTATIKLFHLRDASTDIFAYGGSNITVNNVILTNPVGPSVVGMELNQGNSYTIHNNTIDNIHQSGVPAAVAIDVPFGGVVDIQNNLVTNNNRGVAAAFSSGNYVFNDVVGSLDFNWGQCTSTGCTAASAPSVVLSRFHLTVRLTGEKCWKSGDTQSGRNTI